MSNVATVVCDLDGVVYVDGKAVPGAGDAFRALREQGRRILFVTNNSMKTSSAVVDTVGRLTGFDIDEDSVVTTGRVTAMALAGRAQRVLIVGGPPLIETFREAGFTVVDDWRDAEVVVSGLDFDLTYRDLADATLAIRSGAGFYATNSDATYPTAEGQKPGGGAVVAALTTATGVEPTICGKPYPPMADAVRAIAGEGTVLVVGDRLETDIALGKSQGWLTALVLTGVSDGASPQPVGLEPDLVLDSLADLPAVLAGDQAR